MPTNAKKKVKKQGILHALLPGARLDKNTKKILVNTGTSNETITFNIGGTTFETYKSTLRKFDPNVEELLYDSKYFDTLLNIPHTYLANDHFLAKHYRAEKNEYFFDRDPEFFHRILNYLRTGELHLPSTVCGPVVKSELEFWGIEEIEIEECCWHRYSSWTTTLSALRKLENDRVSRAQVNEYPDEGNLSSVKWRCCQIWKFFADPDSSTVARIYSYVALFIIFASIFSFCAQSHPEFQVDKMIRKHNSSAELPPSYTSIINSTLSYKTNSSSALSESPTVASSSPTSSSSSPTTERDGDYYYNVVKEVPHDAFIYLDIVFFIYFILELSVRFLVSPHRVKFVLQAITVVEFLALVPDAVDLMAKAVTDSDREYHTFSDFMSFLKVLRVFRIFRLMRHIPGLWILFYTLKASLKDLLLLLLFLMLGTLVFSSLVFFAENGTQEDFSSIPKCFWWAVITMTTVGYGDMSPVTNWGYLVGTCTAISGVLMIGFTVPILVNNFVLYYHHTESTIRREKHKDDFQRRMSLAPSSRPGNGGSGGGLNMFSGFGSKLMGMSAFEGPALNESVDSNANHRSTQRNSGRLHEKTNGEEGTVLSKNVDFDGSEEDVKETALL